MSFSSVGSMETQRATQFKFLSGKYLVLLNPCTNVQVYIILLRGIGNMNMYIIYLQCYKTVLAFLYLKLLDWPYLDNVEKCWPYQTTLCRVCWPTCHDSWSAKEQKALPDAAGGASPQPRPTFPTLFPNPQHGQSFTTVCVTLFQHPVVGRFQIRTEFQFTWLKKL